MTPDIETLIERLDRLRLLLPLARLLTVRDVLDAGEDSIRAAGLNPWCMNEGRATGVERIDLPVSEADIDSAIVALRAVQWRPISEDTSDGYHTFKELYGYRRAYNALLFNEWAAAGKFDVHKSWRHSDGELCFGGTGWFIVVAQTPFGQVSNHEKAEHWDLFQVPERERAATWDGHTPQVALERLLATALPTPRASKEEKE